MGRYKMKRLCYGTFATVLLLCCYSHVKQKVLNGTLLKSVDINYDVFDDDALASKLFKCKVNIPPNLKESALIANNVKVSNYFNEEVMPLLNPNMIRQSILAVRDIIDSDDFIEPFTVVNMVEITAKKQIVKQSNFCFVIFWQVFSYIQ